MFVCVCKGITDEQIREAARLGICSMRGLRECLGVASQCGRCALHARRTLERASCVDCDEPGSEQAA